MSNTKNNTTLNKWVLRIYVSLITKNSSNRKMLETIQLCKLYIVKFIISLISFIQISVYNLLKVSLITFTVILFVIFFLVKFFL